MKRICPECRQRTDAKRCPTDGFSTVPAARYDVTQDPLVGQLFEDRYRVDAVIGRGGFGVVYRGTQLAMGRPVAIKVLRPESSTDIEHVRRFQHEARATSAIEHPNVMRVYDFGQTDDGGLYLVSEFLEGEALDVLLKREQVLRPERAVSIGEQVLQALEAAHEAGVVHRDLKPANLIVRRLRDGRDVVKVLDFGIVKFMGPSRDGVESLTATGKTIGTPAYMSPEQAQAQEVDGRADLYSFGVVLYEMLSGRLPFAGTAIDQLIGHIKRQPPPVPHPPKWVIPATLGKLVMRCLEKSPGRRPATATSLRQELLASVGSSPAMPVVRAPSGDLEDAMPTMPMGRKVANEVLAAVAAAGEAKASAGPTTEPVPPQPAPSVVTAPSSSSLVVERINAITGGWGFRLAVVFVVAAASVGGWMLLRRSKSTGPLALAEFVAPAVERIAAPADDDVPAAVDRGASPAVAAPLPAPVRRAAPGDLREPEPRRAARPLANEKELRPTTWVVTSTPSNAEVMWGARKLGTTPYTWTRSVYAFPTSLELRLEKHAPMPLANLGPDGGVRQVALVPIEPPKIGESPSVPVSGTAGVPPPKVAPRKPVKRTEPVFRPKAL